MASSLNVDKQMCREQERKRQLDDKDEEIHQQRQLVEKLKEQLMEQEEMIATCQFDNEKLQKELATLQGENGAAKDETTEVLQALEELCLNYNQKASEAEDTAREFKVITEELQQKQQQLSATVNDMQQLKITSTHRQKKTSEMLTSLLQDLNEAQAMIGKSIGSPIVEITTLGEKVEEECIVARLMGAKMKVVVKNLVYRCQILESSLMDSNNKNQLDKNRVQHQKQVQEDYDRLNMEETDRTGKFQQLGLAQDKRERASKDLNGLQQTVSKELQTVLNLRKMFVNDLQNRLRSSCGVDSASLDSEEDVEGSLAQKQKISFLETNLEQLIKAHKGLVRDNGDLRCELPKLEQRLRVTMERVKALETALRESKEGGVRDRKRYQYEIDRIKEVVRQRNLVRSHAAQIAKPVPAGQPHTRMDIRGGGGYLQYKSGDEKTNDDTADFIWCNEF